MTPRVFAGSGDVEPKLWQQSATSLQSPMTNNLKKSLQQRNKKMKIFTANPNFQDYFCVSSDQPKLYSVEHFDTPPN